MLRNLVMGIAMGMLLSIIIIMSMGMVAHADGMVNVGYTVGDGYIKITNADGMIAFVLPNLPAFDKSKPVSFDTIDDILFACSGTKYEIKGETKIDVESDGFYTVIIYDRNHPISMKQMKVTGKHVGEVKTKIGTTVSVSADMFIQVARYKQPEYCIESDNKDIKKIADEFATNEFDEINAKALYNWVGAHIQYDREKVSVLGVSKFGAAECIKTGKGQCLDMACLYAALCRAVGIPAMVVCGTVEGSGVREFHAWNYVYYNNRWNMADPTVKNWHVDESGYSLIGEYKLTSN